VNFSRKLKRNNLKKQKKQFKKAMNGVSKRLDSLGDNCRACGKSFNKENDSLNSWVVYVVDNDPRLVCPTCKEEIDRLRQDYMEEENVEINQTGSGKT